MIICMLFKPLLAGALPAIVLMLAGCGGDGRRASELSIGETSSVTAQPVAATGSPGPSEAMISAPITSPARQPDRPRLAGFRFRSRRSQRGCVRLSNTICSHLLVSV